MSRPGSVPSEACPVDEELLAWVCGELEGPALARVLRHSERCAACALVVAEAGLALGETEYRSASRTVTRPAAVFEAGQVIASRYVIERRLGRGGMGEVYAALDQELNERVALKTVASTLAAEPRAVERLKLEVRLARSVSHPHVCRVLELGRHALPDGAWQWFFTLQLIAGESLRHRLLRSGPPPLAEALVWAEQLAQGLGAIHAQSVVHRDIKPENVMLTSAQGPAAALWVDFGLARWDMSETCSPGLLQGTPDYAAPELLRGAVASRASDVYALGVLLHELFTGALPFPPRASFMAPPPRDASRVVTPRPELPAALDALVRQCLEGAAELRPASAAELAERLRDVRRQVESPPALRGRPWRWGVAALGLAAAAWAVSVQPRETRSSERAAPGEREPPQASSAPAPPTIASSPAAPVRDPSPPRRATPRRSVSPTASAVAPPQPSAPLVEPAVTDFGGRR